MYKKIYIDKLFMRPPNGNYEDIEIDDESVLCITPHRTSNIICDIIKTNSVVLDPILFDGTAGCGGDTITFAQAFSNVIACELNFERYKMLVNNICVYGLSNVTLLHGNSVSTLPKLNNIDIVYIDPPWGGQTYKKHKNLHLQLDTMFVDEFVNFAFDDELQQSNISMVVIKLPLNYDLYSFCTNISTNLHVSVKLLEKMIIVLVRKVRF